MNAAASTVPKDVQRPLWGAALAATCALLAFCLWAAFAPLATTVSLNGTIISSTPSLELQHPYGGAVEAVFVSPHETVTPGQLLMRLNTRVEQQTQDTQLSIRRRILQENQDIDDVLSSLNHSILSANGERSPYALRHDHVLRQAAASLETAANLRRQIAALQTKIDHSQNQLKLMVARQNRQNTLTEKGLIERHQIEQLREQIFIVRGEIEADRASILNLESQIEQTLDQRDLAKIAWEHELAVTRQQNLSRLDDIQRNILGLRDQIEKAEVRAPTAGVVTSIPVQTEGMFAPRGSTLLTLAQPLDKAQVSFTIPVTYIDQIQTGMSARMTIPSLPQRLMPKIDLKIDAISLRADVDETGAPMAYRGRAIATAETLHLIEAIDGVGPLSEDMPVVLTVSIRETTLAQYLLAPLLASFSAALQD